MGSTIGIVIAVLAAYAAQAAARRKGRHGRRWSIACVVFSPSLLLLEVLPKTGQAGEIEPVPSRNWLNKLPPVWTEVVGVVAVLFGLTWAGFSLARSDYPECASDTAQSQVTSLAKEKLSTIITSYSNTQTLDSPSNERKCSAAVVLGDNSKHIVYYRYNTKDSKIYIFTKFDTPITDADH